MRRINRPRLPDRRLAARGGRLRRTTLRSTVSALPLTRSANRDSPGTSAPVLARGRIAVPRGTEEHHTPPPHGDPLTPQRPRLASRGEGEPRPPGRDRATASRPPGPGYRPRHSPGPHATTSASATNRARSSPSVSVGAWSARVMMSRSTGRAAVRAPRSRRAGPGTTARGGFTTVTAHRCCTPSNARPAPSAKIRDRLHAGGGLATRARLNGHDVHPGHGPHPGSTMLAARNRSPQNPR
jgi:hypothetical protein